MALQNLDMSSLHLNHECLSVAAVPTRCVLQLCILCDDIRRPQSKWVLWYVVKVHVSGLGATQLSEPAIKYYIIYIIEHVQNPPFRVRTSAMHMRPPAALAVTSKCSVSMGFRIRQRRAAPATGTLSRDASAFLQHCHRFTEQVQASSIYIQSGLRKPVYVSH